MIKVRYSLVHTWCVLQVTALHWPTKPVEISRPMPASFPINLPSAKPSIGLPFSDCQLKVKEKTGRWTKEEHKLFLDGLLVHGKAWRKIAKTIKTRSVIQVRTHAQKYFLKMMKSSGTQSHMPVSTATSFDKFPLFNVMEKVILYALSYFIVHSTDVGLAGFQQSTFSVVNPSARSIEGWSPIVINPTRLPEGVASFGSYATDCECEGRSSVVIVSDCAKQ